jgi:DNA-binding CsgD family transcriptional regulator/tetratricopeptide (TPR) repeat protein
VPAFVGRSEELRALVEVGAQAQDGLSAVMIVGDPGSGKTRLLAEAADQLDGLTQLRVVGYEPERDVPLAAAADLVRTLGAVPDWGDRLRAVVYEPDRASALDPVRLFEAAHRTLSRLEPAVLLIDDLQWVDDLSLALCHYLARAAEETGQRLALIAGARASTQAASFAGSLSHVLPTERLTMLELGSLRPEEALELVVTLAPAFSRDEAQRVAQKAGGSPFWVEALVRTAGAEADAGQLVTARLHGVSADSAALLALLAVAARPIGLGDVPTIQHWSSERVEASAADLVARGVAVYDGGSVRLAHDLIRVAAVRDVPLETRLEVHRRLSLWLEGVAGNDVQRLRDALYHRHMSGLSSLELANRLMRSPQPTLLGNEGLALLTRIADEGDPTDERVLELDQEIASLATQLAAYSVALERWLLVAERAPEAGLQASALLQAARSSFALNDEQSAREYLTRAREVQTADELFELELDTQQAAIGLWFGDDRGPARRFASEIAKRAHRMGERPTGVSLDARTRRVYLEALRVEYDLAFQNDEVNALLTTSEERAEVARGFDTEAYLGASIASARALRRLGRLRESDQRLRSVWEEAHRRVLPQLTIDAAYWLGTVLELQGRIVEAEEVVAEAAELAARVGDEARGRHGILRLECEISFHRGDWRSAVARLLELAQETSTHGRIQLYQDGALWLALLGRDDLEPEVLSLLADARACAEEAACPRCGTELQLAAAEVLARTGHLDEAAQSLAEWERLQENPQPRDRLIQQRVEALLQSDVGNGAAATMLDAAIEEAERLALTLDALWTRIDLGRRLAESNPERGIEVLGAAADSATQMGAVTEGQVAEQLLRSLGVRTWRRGPAAEPLTDRERQIIRLISGGASNPEIAQQLFLSRKTVERHVSNVFRKVGVRNRAELAARVAELELEGAPR